MGKTRRGTKEFTKEQRLVKENRQLKRELNHLRKQIARLDGDRFEVLREMVADQEETERFQQNMGESVSNTEALKRDWACRACSSGFLQIILYSKQGLTHYYRKCSECDHRTKGKRYDDQSVKGIIKSE